MLNAFARILLTSSAIAPVGLTYAWVAYMQGEMNPAVVILAASFATVAICLLLLRYARKNLEGSRFQAKEIAAADRENMGFLLLYLLPLFTSQFNTLNWQLWIPTLIIFAMIVDRRRNGTPSYLVVTTSIWPIISDRRGPDRR